MKKPSVKKYGILSVICWIVGTFLVIIANQSAEFELGIVAKYSIGCVGIILFVLAFIGMYKAVNIWFATDEAAKIEENDERNILIRGKVAQDVNLFSSVIFTLIMIILLIANEMLGVILIALAHFATNMYQAIRFKKYEDEL